MEDTAKFTAPNGTVVEAGGIYLTFSGDYDLPCKIVKIIRIGEGSADTHPNSKIMPNAHKSSEPDLWIKLYLKDYAEAPEYLVPELLGELLGIVPITPSVFLAWGPPKYPIRLGSEPVTAEELSWCVSDCCEKTT